MLGLRVPKRMKLNRASVPVVLSGSAHVPQSPWTVRRVPTRYSHPRLITSVLEPHNRGAREGPCLASPFSLLLEAWEMQSISSLRQFMSHIQQCVRKEVPTEGPASGLRCPRPSTTAYSPPFPASASLTIITPSSVESLRLFSNQTD